MTKDRFMHFIIDLLQMAKEIQLRLLKASSKNKYPFYFLKFSNHFFYFVVTSYMVLIRPIPTKNPTI